MTLHRHSGWVEAPSYRALVAILLVCASLAGCVGTGDETLDPASDPGAQTLIDQVLTLPKEGGWRLDVPVKVFVIGFEDGVAEALDRALSDEKVFHAHSSATTTVPPDPANPALPLAGETFAHPHVPSAVYEVVEPDAQLQDAFWSAVANETVDTELPDVYDANAAEALLHDALTAAGHDLDGGVASLVLLHAQDHLPGDHAWRLTLPEGYLEPVRHFGEHTPLVVHDLSARPDPYLDRETTSPIGLVFRTAFGPTPNHAYDEPTGPGVENVDVLEAYVRDATHHRVLQGAIYPVSTKPCHHVDLLMAVDQTALTNVLPGFTRAQGWVDEDRLRDAFANATGDEVTTRLSWLTLPQDDPALSALLRASGSLAGLDALRFYLDENWERFSTAPAGCEAYLSVLYFADAASEPGRLFGGIGMYDVDTDRRISFSIVTDVSRFEDEYTGPGEDALAPRDPSEQPRTLVDLLFSHETGHLLGLHHPQHLQKAADPSPANDAFQSVYSVMSYQVGTRVMDFGAIDTLNWQRNRAGFAVLKAQILGLDDTPSFKTALHALATNDWVGVQQALEAQIQAADREHAIEDERLSGFGVHAHPGR